MDKREIAEIVGAIMYLDDWEDIDSGKSLFREYKMSSIDFVDFAFEVKSRSGKQFDPLDLWPINAMLTDPEFFNDGKWTQAGKARLKLIFPSRDIPGDPELSDLYEFFSVDYVVQRLEIF